MFDTIRTDHRNHVERRRVDESRDRLVCSVFRQHRPGKVQRRHRRRHLTAVDIGINQKTRLLQHLPGASDRQRPDLAPLMTGANRFEMGHIEFTLELLEQLCQLVVAQITIKGGCVHDAPLGPRMEVAGHWIEVTSGHRMGHIIGHTPTFDRQVTVADRRIHCEHGPAPGDLSTISLRTVSLHAVSLRDLPSVTCPPVMDQSAREVFDVMKRFVAVAGQTAPG